MRGLVFSAAPRQTFETTARAFPVKASPMPRKSSTRGIRSAESTTRASTVSLVSSVRKEADKLAAAVETAAEEVKPVAEAAPKKKRGFSPFKFGKKKEA